jgi:hypothetical protein
MFLWLGISILVQLALIIHVVRNGRNSIWIMAIFFFPFVGALAYFIVEILPGLQNTRQVRTAKAHVASLIDPERELRSANEELAIVDTPSNRVKVGDALASLNRHAEAIPHYVKALVRGEDASTMIRLSQALLETGKSDEALRVLDKCPDATTVSERDRRSLLRARILEHLGHKGEAEDLYTDIISRLPGEEARCRYAGLLLERGAKDRAREVLEEVELRMKRLTRAQRAPDAEMYDWAMRELTALRAK